MNIEEYLDNMRSIQSEFLEFIEEYENIEEKFHNLCLILEEKKIRDNKNDLSLFLHHISSVCANHHRGENFFNKITRVLQLFKDDFKNYYANSEIFNIFKRNKRILLFLIEENMMIFDRYIIKTITKGKYIKNKYPQYFWPEIKTFMNEKWFPKYDSYNNNWWVKEIKKELPDNFYELRKIGENESYISKLIREDLVQDFIVYANQINMLHKARIIPSIYETNSFLIKKQNNVEYDKGVLVMEYAAFFGSIQIKYLQMQGEEITPSLIFYAIHSQNAELIHFLEDCHAIKKSYDEYYKESIKCNHNAIADYFLNNYLENDYEILNCTFNQILKSYNFIFLQKQKISELSFFDFCIYDYYFFVDYILMNYDININKREIHNRNFQLHSESYFSITFRIIFFNTIQNHFFQLHTKS